MKNNEGQSDEEFTTTFSPSGNYSDDNFVEQWEHSAQYLFDGEGRAGCGIIYNYFTLQVFH